jgi:UDP-glucose 4-epimerase
LVTGGAGFIGSNIAEKLVQLGHQVRVLDDFSTGFRSNLASFENELELIEGDLRDYDTVAKAVDSVDYILHQAALPSVPGSVAEPIRYNQVNIDGTLNLLEAARQAGVKKLVMASSSAIYGDDPKLPKQEDMRPEPMTPYAIAKQTNEYYCRAYWQLYKMPTACLRYFNVFGPRQNPKSEYAAVIPKFITALQNGKQPTVFGDGGQSRDFTYIDDIVSANLFAIDNQEMVGDVYNCACGVQYTLNQLLDLLRKIIGTDIEAIYEEARVGDIRHSYATIERLLGYGFKPAVSFEDGLKRTAAYFGSKTPV